eukprot:g9736.t1
MSSRGATPHNAGGGEQTEPLTPGKYKPGCAAQLSPPAPWQPLALTPSPGRQRPYVNIKSAAYETPTTHRPLPSEWTPYENAGSMVDLGLHRGASLRDFYKPSRDPMVGRENLDGGHPFLGNYKGAKVDRTVNYYAVFHPCKEIADENQAEADAARSAEAVKLRNQQETQAYLARYRTSMEALQEVQTKQKIAAREQEREERKAEAKRRRDEEFVANASRRQEILDRRPPWKEPELAPGPGARHPVLSDASETQGTYKELLYGIFTNGGQTRPPHFIGDAHCPALHGDKTFGYVNRASGQIDYANRPPNSLSPKERQLRRKLKMLTMKMSRSASADALNDSLGYVRRARFEELEAEELAKWMKRDLEGNPAMNTFFDLCGGGHLWK